MAERPILFSAPMVRALLAGTKTQTRRIVKLPKESTLRGGWEATTIGGPGVVDDQRLPVAEEVAIWNQTTGKVITCPFGTVGDRLWVREAHYFGMSTEEHFHNDIDGNSRSSVDWCWPQSGDLESVAYAADGPPPADRCERWRLRPSIHMPRWASRLTLEITGVRVERLQAITGRDVLAEGVDNGKSNPTQGERWENLQRLAFESLWSEINGADSWRANPWVWALTFKRLAGGAA